MQNKFITFISLLFSLVVFAQKEKLIQGKVIVKDAKSSGIRVVNLFNEKETFTNTDGDFTILAKPDDLLVFSADFLDYMRKIIDEVDYNKGKFEILMTAKVTVLDEVEIRDYSRINAVSLGILSKPAKKYTPAQRRLQTATGLYPTLYAGTMAGGSIGLDPLMNWISGRTKMLKNALKSEEKEILLQRLNYFYSDEFFTDNLKIEQVKLGSFKNFVVYDAILIEAIQAKNKARMEFNLYRLAAEFKQRNQEDDGIEKK